MFVLPRLVVIKFLDRAQAKIGWVQLNLQWFKPLKRDINPKSSKDLNLKLNQYHKSIQFLNKFESNLLDEEIASKILASNIKIIVTNWLKQTKIIKNLKILRLK